LRSNMIESGTTLVASKRQPAGGSASTASQKEQLLARLTDNVNLPRPPAIVLQILEFASRPHCSIEELANLVYGDPVMCGKLLQTVNSALFGLRSPVASVQRALALLGLRQIRSLVLGLSLPALHDQCKPSSAMNEHWKYAVMVAVVGHELAVHRGSPSPSDDLVAGLLCDLGTMVFQQVHPAQFAALRENSMETLAEKQCELEEKLLGVNHAEVGAHLLCSWRLPAEITEPVLWHHHPKSVPTESSPEVADRAQLLYFATQMANIQAGGLSPSLRESVLDLARSWLGLDEHRLLSLLEPIRDKVKEFAALLKVEIGTFANYSDLFANATQELVRLSLETSTDALKTRSASRESTLWRMLKAADCSPQETLSPAAGAEKEKTGALDDSLFLETTIDLGHYTLIEVLGRGGMGVVFRAFDNRLRRHVAIKLLGPWISSQPQARERFAREGQAAASIKHENVVAVYAVEESEDLAFLVMEYVDGLSLQDKLDAETLRVKEIYQIGAQIAEGLAAAHAQKLIHRDIKPANILLSKINGQVKISDFGLARPLDNPSMTQEGVLVGTPEYMAPEQVRGETLDYRADLFSLGGVLYTMCAGTPPFGSDVTSKILRRIVDDSPRSLREIARTIPNDLIAIVEMLLAKEPNDRIQSAKELAKLLRRQLVSL
jgi:eukaryotic-like serine/threonine-protein kinase